MLEDFPHDPNDTSPSPLPAVDPDGADARPADRADDRAEPHGRADRYDRADVLDLAEQAPTTRRGRYRLGERLGRGGASVVHRGWDRRLERPVAVKVFTVEAPAAADREARLAAGMDHPGLVPVYDVEELGGHDAVVMPLVEGPSLAARLADAGPMPVSETLRIGAQLAAGLAHVHAHGIVHRDVKPSNVLLGERGARLTDFGIARVPGTTTITGDGLVLGTAAYLAPEQIRAEEVGPAADVFALGLVLIECLTASSCYSSAPGACAGRLDRMPDLPADLDERVGDALTALTRLDPAERPAAADAAVRLTRLHAEVTAAEVTGDELTAAGAGLLPVGAASVSGRAGPGPRLSTTVVVTAVVLVAVVAVAVAALLAGRPDVAIPLIVAVIAAQGAVVCLTLARGWGAPRM